LDQKVLAEAQAAENLRNSRKANKTYFDQQKRFRGDQQQLRVGDLVLLHNSKKLKTHSSKDKVDDNWFGPYRIREIPENSTFYLLEELDGTHLAQSFAGNRLKKFFTREVLNNDKAPIQEVIDVRDDLENDDLENDDDGENDDNDHGGISHHVMLRM